MKWPVRSFSFLGIILTIASHIAAAIIPDNRHDVQTNSADNGILLQNSGQGGTGGELSCVTLVAGNGNCHETATNITHTEPSSDYVGNRTAGNTSLSSAGGAGDQTSIVS